MRAIRLALDPFGILNPGKTIPPAEEMTFAPDRVIGDVGSP
jgi:hypothetical protein